MDTYPWPTLAEQARGERAHLKAEAFIPARDAVQKLIGMMKFVRAEARRHQGDCFVYLVKGLDDEISDLIGGFWADCEDAGLDEAVTWPWKKDLEAYAAKTLTTPIDSMRD